jgi:hypothetical protein
MVDIGQLLDPAVSRNLREIGLGRTNIRSRSRKVFPFFHQDLLDNRTNLR